VPLAWGEVIPAAQQGVIDGADLPIVNILALKAYEVSKYCSMTFHNYGPTAAVINLDIWHGLTEPPKEADRRGLAHRAADGPPADRERRQYRQGQGAARAQGMAVNRPMSRPSASSRKTRVCPPTRRKFPEMWEEIVATKV